MSAPLTVEECEKNFHETGDTIHLNNLYKLMMPYAEKISSHYCREYNCGNLQPEIAHNVVSNTIMKFVRNQQFSFNGGYKGYLSKAIHNYLIDEFRKKKPVSIEVLADQAISIDDKILQTVITGEIKKKIRQIVKRYAVTREEKKVFEADIIYCLKKGESPLYRIYRYKGRDKTEIRHRYKFCSKLVLKYLERYSE